jgi:hypothetical protein
MEMVRKQERPVFEKIAWIMVAITFVAALLFGLFFATVFIPLARS